MGEKLVIGPINKGLRLDREAFVIDNDSFPTLLNAYQWRGRVKRKRGTSFLGRLQRFLGSTDGIGNESINILPIPIATGVSTFVIGTDIFIDPGTTADPATQTLITNSSGTGTLNRVSGALTITGSQPSTSIIMITGLPVMGLEELNINPSVSPGTIAFDTRYSYNIATASPFSITDVSFYKNPPSGTPGSYVQKVAWTPTSWNGKDYQQFWTTNYKGALWETNGIDVPFSGGTIGMQFAITSAATRISATTMQFTIAGNPLVIGDFVFVNEFSSTAAVNPPNSAQLNFQTGYVTAAGATFTVTFPNANIPADTYSNGLVQYLTNRSNTAIDSLRWYDGSPVDGNIPPTFVTGSGWVNFSPPLSQASFSIGGLPAAQYYLVGARIIVPFKDRLLFFGPVVQTSTGTPKYLQDTIIYSQVGTPYYTASFQGNIFAPTNPPGITTLLVPTNQKAFPTAYWCDQTGFGGFITAGVSQPINSVGVNEDVLIVGFKNFQTRLIYSGNDIVPFNFFIVNSELGTSSTFSTIIMDKAVLTRGDRGIIATSQVGAQRYDLEIPDQVFEFDLQNNGSERVTAQRDFENEWCYLSYPTPDNGAADGTSYIFPTQTLQYNYRDNSWGIFDESYTTYGPFRESSTPSWATIKYTSWNSWTDPWDFGISNSAQPIVIAGNQQGFVVFRNFENGISEATSLAIMNLVYSAGVTTVTCPNHSLNEGDYIIISGALGTIGAVVNGLVFSVGDTTTNTFTLNPSVVDAVYTYLGGGLITRLYVPFIQTKQFPTGWELMRKTRIGPQQYLLTTTEKAQITLLIFLSQNGTNPYNLEPIVPDPNSINNSLIYSTILYTCPESSNIGLTAPNTNLQMPTASQQAQIWHRVNTSLIGDTIQLGFTLSDTQMRTLDSGGLPISQFAEIELHSIIMDIQPSMLLS